MRPHHHAQNCPLRFLASSKSEFLKTVQISRRTKARRSKGSEPAPRVKQRVKIKMSRSQSRIPQEMQAGRRGNPAKRKTARSCGVVLVVKMFAMRASQRCVHSSILIQKKNPKQMLARSERQIKVREENAVHVCRGNSFVMLKPWVPKREILVMVNIGYHRRIA